MDGLLELLLGPAFPWILRSALRRRRIPLAYGRREWSEDVRQAALLEILSDPSPPPQGPARWRRIRRAVGRACWRLIERDRRFERARIPLETVAGEPARAAGAEASAMTSERTERLSPDARRLLEGLLSQAARGKSPQRIARSLGIPLERSSRLLAEVAGGLLEEGLEAELASLLERQIAELDGAIPTGSARAGRRARALARILRHLPAGLRLGGLARRLLRLEADARRARAGRAAVTAAP